MVGVSASVNLPLHHKLQKLSSGTGSPGWSRKKGHKMVVCVCVCLWPLMRVHEHRFVEVIYHDCSKTAQSQLSWYLTLCD